MDDIILNGLNAQQRQAVLHGNEPLLIVAGAGTGKTNTLVHRVAHLIEMGTDPVRILLLTFSRRAAGEMLGRVDQLLRQVHERFNSSAPSSRPRGRKVWGG